jgi:hypothetical protein
LLFFSSRSMSKMLISQTCVLWLLSYPLGFANTHRLFVNSGHEYPPFFLHTLYFCTRALHLCLPSYCPPSYKLVKSDTMNEISWSGRSLVKISACPDLDFSGSVPLFRVFEWWSQSFFLSCVPHTPPTSLPKKITKEYPEDPFATTEHTILDCGIMTCSKRFCFSLTSEEKGKVKRSIAA